MTILPWDMNLSQLEVEKVCNKPEESRPLYDNLMTVSQYQRRYFEIMADFLEGPGAMERLHNRIDAASAVLDEHLPMSDEQLTQLKSTIENRTDFLKSALENDAKCE